ncbi:prolyl oligopeptidase family serine peptidase [Cerasicoccus maritimus]|uniref:prolyl oligopeptidase family serine peptidase n=1 Tax=Cerasicoccus maritimus TaxID=490089 RepID=UPI002852863C|nr:prolyl oligopeptidase family serine peptidase [Cerasicoccus maritimus]
MDETPPPIPRRNPLGPLPPVTPPSAVPPPMPPQGAPYHAAEPEPEPRLCKMAVGSCILSVLGFFMAGIPSFFGFIFGIVAMIRIKRSDGDLKGKGWAISGIVSGAVIMIAIGVFIQKFSSIIEEQMVANEEPFAYINTPPNFKGLLDRADRTSLGDVHVLQVKTHGSEPAQNMQLRIYLPAGAEDAAPGSLPCVLVAPAGTDLLSGAMLGELDDEAYHDETLPYAEAGIVTVFYSIDGGGEDYFYDDDSMMEAASSQYDQFRDAQAGILNGRYALEFVLAELPMVNPEQIYTAGHSSAGTLSLLLAMHEPRVAGCLAYAPGVDIEVFHAELLDTPLIGLIFPNVKNFLRKSSPINNVEKLQCPTFLFQSMEDEVVEIGEFNAFTDRLKAQPNAPEFDIMIIEQGDHYWPMIEDGMPAGIEWIKERVSTSGEVTH